MSKTFTIHDWRDESVLAEQKAETLKEALEKLVASGTRLDFARLDGARLDGASLDRASLDRASLIDARLDGASLDRASLDRARLDRASLDGASLIDARLDGASLVGASLDRASLDGASLDGARLVGARLDGARLDRASLVGARLDRASLVGASLGGARLEAIKHDLWGVLMHAQPEIEGLTLALREGRVNGSVYEGECACLIGTIANLRHCRHVELSELRPDSHRPAEAWFTGIRKGDTAQTNQIVKITLDWIAEFKQLISEGAST